jgi:hypothetical protein
MKLLSLVGVILLLTVTVSNANGQDFDDEDDFNYNVEESPTEPEPEKKEEPAPPSPPETVEEEAPPATPEPVEEEAQPATPEPVQDEAARAASIASEEADKAIEKAKEKKREAEKKAQEEAQKEAEKTVIEPNESIPNKIQYTRPLRNQNYGGKDYDNVIEIGFYLPPAYNVGDKVRIKDRSARRAGSKEAADFLNRESGHVVLAVHANKNYIGGNGGWIIIESMDGAGKDDFVGGGTNEHTFDGAHGYKHEL